MERVWGSHDQSCIPMLYMYVEKNTELVFWTEKNVYLGKRKIDRDQKEA